MDGNTYALNKMLQEEEEREKSLENFQSNAEVLLNEISEKIEELKYLKDSYTGYDFTEDLNDMIKEII